MILSKLNGPGISFILKMGELGLEAAGDSILMSPDSDYAEEGRLLTLDCWRKGILRSTVKGSYRNKMDKRLSLTGPG